MIEFPVPITYGNPRGCPTQLDMYGVVVLDGKDEALTLSRQAMCGGLLWDTDSNGQLRQCTCSS